MKKKKRESYSSSKPNDCPHIKPIGCPHLKPKSLPHWGDHAYYETLLDASSDRLAWEFLRRNSAYWHDYHDLANTLGGLKKWDAIIYRLINKRAITSTDRSTISSQKKQVTPQDRIFHLPIMWSFSIFKPSNIIGPEITPIDSIPKKYLCFIRKYRILMPVNPEWEDAPLFLPYSILYKKDEKNEWEDALIEELQKVISSYVPKLFGETSSTSNAQKVISSLVRQPLKGKIGRPSKSYDKEKLVEYIRIVDWDLLVKKQREAETPDILDFFYGKGEEGNDCTSEFDNFIKKHARAKKFVKGEYYSIAIHPKEDPAVIFKEIEMKASLKYALRDVNLVFPENQEERKKRHEEVLALRAINLERFKNKNKKT